MSRYTEIPSEKRSLQAFSELESLSHMVSTHAVIGGYGYTDHDDSTASSLDLADIDEQSIESDEEYTDSTGSLKDFIVDDDDDDEYEFDDGDFSDDDDCDDDAYHDDEDGDRGENDELDDSDEDDILASPLNETATMHRRGAIVAYIDRDGYHPLPGFESRRLRSGISFQVREDHTESGISGPASVCVNVHGRSCCS